MRVEAEFVETFSFQAKEEPGQKKRNQTDQETVESREPLSTVGLPGLALMSSPKPASLPELGKTRSWRWGAS